MEDFSLNKVLKLKNKNEKKNDYIIDYHYSNVVQKIKRFYKEYAENCYYEVDTIVPGLPLYNANKITELLVKRMIKNGFQCRLIYQNKIFIFWKPKERRKEYIPDIYKLAKKRIEQEARKDKDEIFFEVPVLLAGHPWYDASDVAIIIGRKLKKKGFIVQNFEKSNVIFISWNIKKIENKNRTKINFKTMEEKRKEALEKINYINEKRYTDFINPKKTVVPKQPPIIEKDPIVSKIDLKIKEPKIYPQSRFSMNDNFLRGLSNLKNDVRNIL